MKDFFNLRKSKQLLLALLAMVAGASPVGAQKTLPYSYDFSTALGTEGWTMESCHNSTGISSGAFRFYYNSNPPQYLISPELQTIDSSVDVSFQYKAQNTTYTESFQVGYSETDNEPASFQWEEEVKTNNTSYSEYKTTFPAGVKYVAIKYTANDKYYLYIDDFKICKTPTCITPTGLTTSNLTSSSVTLNWKSDAEAWNVQYKKAADSDWTDVSGNITSKPYTLTGLSSATDYQARVRTYCDATDQSEWTDAVSFTTDCATITSFPYSESFNSLTSGIPMCWNNTEGTTTTDSYKWNFYATGHNGACVRFNSYNNSSNNTNMLKTPAMNFTSGKLMQLSFWYKNPTGGDFSVYISNDGGVTYTTSLATALTGQSDWKQQEIVIPAEFSENVVIVFKATSNYGNGDAYIYLDDVVVEEAPACPKPTALTASDVLYDRVTLSWTAGSDETKWKIIYGAAGFDLASEYKIIDNVTTNPYTLTGLDSETAYDVYVKAVKGSDESVLSDKATFTTTERYPAPTGLAVSNVTTTSATLTWTAGDATSWEVAINTTGDEPTEAGNVVNAATYDFTGLTAETTYYAFVRTKDGDNYSNWSTRCAFIPSAFTYLTVNDGTNTNSYVPITVNTYGSSLQRTQFVIPATELASVVNNVIKKLSFYATSESNNLGDMEYDVYLKEVDNATITSSTLTDWDTMAKVYSGKLSVSGGKMDIFLTSDFNFSGKNLLVGISQTSTGTGESLSFYGKSSTNYMAVKWDASGNERPKFSPKTTIGYQAKTGSELKVFDGENELTESPASFDFGLAAAGATHTFTLKNTAATPYEATISSTLTVSPAKVTPTAEGVTFTVAMPARDITNEAVVITPAKETGLEAFTINVSGTLRDADKFYQVFNTTSRPTGWTAEGSWSYSAANGAYTSAWYIDQGTLARLKTPLLNLAAGEKFIFEAKGYSTSNTSYQHLVLQYSADGTSWTTFSDDFGTAISADPTSWKTFTATLPSGVDAGRYYIGILASQADIRMFYGGKVVTGANFAINVAEGAEQDFGSVKANATAEKSYTVTNNGNAALQVTIAGTDDFTVSTASLNIAAGGSESFTVTMNTTTAGDKSGNVQLTFDALNAQSFTIPCKGNVKDPNLLMVDFEDNTFPEGWQTGADWSVSLASSNHFAVQSNTRTASAITTSPLTVAENEELTFQVSRNQSGQGYVTSLKVRYSDDGGASWSDYTSYSIESSALETKAVTGVPAGTVILEFLGSNIKLDNIEGFLKTTKPALAITEAGTAVTNGDTKDFGYLSADGTATYTVKNIGNATLKAAITGEGVTVSPASVEIAAGETADITVTMAYGDPYGEKTGKLTIDAEDEWIADFVVNFTASLVDPDDFVEDFTSGLPAGWYNGGWTFNGETASRAQGTAADLITKKLEAAEGKNVLTFKAKYSSEYLDKTLKVYTSTDRGDFDEWTLQKEVTLTADYADVALDELTVGQYYYVKFEAANAIIDDVKGLKNVAVPDHDMMPLEFTGLKTSYTPGETATATVKFANLRGAESNVYVETYYRMEGNPGYDVWTKSEPVSVVAGDMAASISVTAAIPDVEGEYTMYATVFYGDNDSFVTDGIEFTVAHTTSLEFTAFEPVSKNVEADGDNMFTAQFNVTVKNTGSTNFDAGAVTVTVTDKDNNPYENATATLASPLSAGESATLTVTVTADAGNGGQFEFNVTENVTNTFWYPTKQGWLETVNVTAAPAIVLNENSSDAFATGNNRKVRLTHTFVAGWNTVCLPFSCSVTDIDASAKALEFSAYNSKTKELTFSPVDELAANKPYVIWVENNITETIEFTGKNVVTSEQLGVEHDGVTFQGTYAPVTFSAIGDGPFYGLTAAGKIAKGSDTVTMKGFRAYFNGLTGNATARFLDLDDTQGISTISMETAAPEGTYNMQGQKVEQLRKGGLYIINGKKQIVK